MGKISSLIIGGIVGATAGAVANYLFSPARGTEFDQTYRSRWDKALEEGQQAAEAREAELRRQLAAAKQFRPQA
jgi:gas vesicle protein